MTSRPTHPPPPHPPPGQPEPGPGGREVPRPSEASPPSAGSAGRWHYRRSLASRVIWLTTIAVGLAVAVVALGAYLTVRMQMQSALDDSLVERARTASPRLCDRDVSVPPEYLGAANTWVVCISGQGAVGHSTSEIESIPLGSEETAVIRGEDRLSVRTVVGDDNTQWRVVALNRDNHTIILAQSLAHQQSVLGKLGIVMVVFGGLGVAGAGVAGWLVARNGLRPVRRLTKAAENIARTEDLTPLPVEGDDEIARLAAAFNQMLQALDSSRKRQRQLVADAGHELRTPMTTLRTNIDLLDQATSNEGPVLEPEARAELLHDVRAQIEELTQLIGDLTELSRERPPASVIEDVELSEVVHRAAARVRLRAPSVQFDVVAHPWWVTGDAAALERAATNLLDNAAKWSPAGGHVSCRLVDGVLTVDDEGPGIPEADKERVFDRFWRSSESRTMPGSGLGLSIVRQVADRHSATVEVQSAPGGGARLVMTLPGVPDEPA